VVDGCSALLDSLFHEGDEAEAAVLLRLVLQRHVHVLDLAEGEERGVDHRLRHGLVQTTCRRKKGAKPKIKNFVLLLTTMARLGKAWAT
jgi:hypothetical protein